MVMYWNVQARTLNIWMILLLYIIINEKLDFSNNAFRV